MFIQRKQYLASIVRQRVAEGRDLADGLRLDRNEKVDVWPRHILADIFAAQPDYFLSVYPEPGRLYQKLATFHGVDESELLLTAGIDGGLKTLFEIMTEPGDLVGVVRPTYAMYQVYARLFQVNLCEVSYTENRDFGFHEWDAMLARKPTMVFLPNPNQPVESAFTLGDLERFAQATLAQHCLFVIDEAYHMFGCESGVSLIRRYENIVIARTFSKGFGVPSIRLGYLMSTRDNLAILSKTRYAHESNALSNAVAEYLLDHTDIVEEYNRRVVEARTALKPLLGELGIPAHGSAGNFLLLDLGSEQRATSFVAALRAGRIYVKGPCPLPWQRYVTISLGPVEVMERFVEATRAFSRECA